MRGQSEAVGLAIIVALVIGSIIAYSVLSGDDPEPNDSDRIIAENFAYVLVSSDIETDCGTQRMWSVLDTIAQYVDPCSAGTNLDFADARPIAEEKITSITSRTIDEWGYEYELRFSDRDGQELYGTGDCGFSRGGVSRQTFRRSGAVLEFALCS